MSATVTPTRNALRLVKKALFIEMPKEATPEEDPDKAKMDALFEVTFAIKENRARLYEHNGLRYIAARGTHETLKKLQMNLLWLGITSRIYEFGFTPRLASTQSRFLLELESAINTGADVRNLIK